MPNVTAAETPAAAIWCLACKDSLIVAGCGNGRIEVRFLFSSVVDLKQFAIDTEPCIEEYDIAFV